MENIECSKLQECLACGSKSLTSVLDLGNQPLANSYKNSRNEKQKEYPLAINHCDKCFHVQLTHTVNPKLMFDNYLYVSGTSQTMKEHFKWFARFTNEYFSLLNEQKIRPKTILDIGCNDGSQLDAYKESGVMNTDGIDPAKNLSEVSSSKGHKIYCEYFDTEFVKKRLCWGIDSVDNYFYDLIVAQNVFAHNFDPLSFLKNAKLLLSRNGLIFIQTSQADMILNNEFDTIYHEHLSFFNIQSMNALCKRANLKLIDVTKCPLHGNSYIFVISTNLSHVRPAHMENLLDMEKKSGLYDNETYKKYAERCLQIKKDIQNLDTMDYILVGYGAAAKGMTFLNYTGLNLDYIVDDNPLKQDKFTPGRGIPIYSSDKLKFDPHKIMFVPLAWNFFDEIKAKIKEKRSGNYDRFLKYFPKVEIE